VGDGGALGAHAASNPTPAPQPIKRSADRRPISLSDAVEEST
jgi:hypothetical protein